MHIEELLESILTEMKTMKNHLVELVSMKETLIALAVSGDSKIDTPLFCGNKPIRDDRFEQYKTDEFVREVCVITGDVSCPSI
jgi:hypothetical protein